MDLRIRAEGFRLTGALYDFVQLRLKHALARFEDPVDEVHVRLRDENGPRGGIDKGARFDVRMRGQHRLLIDERDDDLYTAIGRGARRVERQVARMVARRRDVLRG